MNRKLYQEYDKDFYAWAVHNAELIRQGKLSEVDLEHLAEEIESIGKSEKRELLNRLAVLIAHLLKWQFQPAKRGNSWKYTIEEQRIKLVDLLEESPSLNAELQRKIDHAYMQAVVIATRQTGLMKNTFPSACPYSLKDCLNFEFLPDSDQA